jgi:hypothetical protein
MLDATLTTDFLPGTNLKGGSAGANWTYVLSSLELEQVVTVGEPRATTLATLSRNAKRVIVMCSNRRGLKTVQRTVEQRGFDNVTVLPPKSDDRSAIRDNSTDLLFVVRRFDVFRLKYSTKRRAQWRRWLKPQGQLYLESSGLAYNFLRGVERAVGEHHDSQSFWLTPLSGESHTFTPLDDHETIRFFRQQQLTSPSLRSGVLKQMLSRGKASQAQSESRQPRSSNPSQPARESYLKTAARGAIRTCNRLEQFLSGSSVLRRTFGRRGVLVGPDASRLGQGPPEYLQTIARDSGVSIESYRWGLSASGDYDSRKLVFFLFDQDQSSPTYVVKMTRSALFNSRLELERRGLELLEEKGIGKSETLPRVVFAGTHGGLSIVGETAIDGVPFDRRTTATASCPHARAAVGWLTSLGAATAAPFAAEPGEVAAGLQQLLSRFAELYPISSDEYAFLQSQLAVIEFNRLPLVFQHGDPGRWNVFVTSDDQVCFLDWEASEPNGLPLWDLFYFLRSFCVCVAQSQHCTDSLRSLDQLLLEDTPLATLVVDSVKNYCAEIGMSESLVEPLFYTCWLHRALKESTRLPETELREGHYFNLLRLCMERRESPTLQRLFATN